MWRTLHHAEQRLPCWCGRVDALLIEVEINVLRVYLRQERHEILETPSEPINTPGRNKIELTTGYALTHLIERWPSFPSLRT